MPSSSTSAPSGTSASASQSVVDVKMPRSIPPGIAQYQSGSGERLEPGAQDDRGHDERDQPIGNWSIRKTRSFQVAGSASRALSRYQRRALAAAAGTGSGMMPVSAR